MWKTGTLAGFLGLALLIVSGAASFTCESDSLPIIYSDADVDADADADADGEIIPPSNSSGIMEPPKCTSRCSDFPAGPYLDTNVPPNSADIFGNNPDNFQPSGFCVHEPQLGVFDGSSSPTGTIFPANWLRPRFRFESIGNENLFEIRLSAEKEIHDMVIYTLSKNWTMPDSLWNIIRTRVIDVPITVTVRGVNMQTGSNIVGLRGQIMIAPVRAGGQMMYWASTSSEVRADTSLLVSLIVGDEKRVNALTIPQVGDRKVIQQSGLALRDNKNKTQIPAGHVECIGCHVATPDGKAVSFTDHWPWNIVLSSVDTINQEVPVGQSPTFLTQGAQVILNQPWLGMQAFSKAHWSESEKIMIAGFTPRNIPETMISSVGTSVGFTSTIPYPSTGDRLIWIDLMTPFTFTGTNPPNATVLNSEMLNAYNSGAFGFLNTSNERSISTPVWSHDGRTIAYTSSTYTQDGRLSEKNNDIDIHLVDFNNRQGGTPRCLGGACDTTVFEYYPAFSADDKLIAFNRAPKNNTMVYYRPDSEIFIVPAEGGTPVKLAANDPPVCSGQNSAQLFNSWAKWSPFVVSTTSSLFPPARSFYFLIFSSGRKYPEQFTIPPTEYSPPDTRSSQLYMATIIKDETTGAITTYPAIYLWNQDPRTSNLTPAWDDFQIAPIMK